MLAVNAPHEPTGQAAEMAQRLLDHVDDVVKQFTARLCADRQLPHASVLSEAALRDHAGTMVAEIATTIAALGEREGAPHTVVRDSGELLRVLGELHGVQRRKQGWSEAEVGRELDVLGEEIANALRRLSTGSEDSLAYALWTATRLMGQVIQTSQRSHRALTNSHRPRTARVPARKGAPTVQRARRASAPFAPSMRTAMRRSFSSRWPRNSPTAASAVM